MRLLFIMFYLFNPMPIISVKKLIELVFVDILILLLFVWVNQYVVEVGLFGFEKDVVVVVYKSTYGGFEFLDWLDEVYYIKFILGHPMPFLIYVFLTIDIFFILVQNVLARAKHLWKFELYQFYRK